MIVTPIAGMLKSKKGVAAIIALIIALPILVCILAHGASEIGGRSQAEGRAENAGRQFCRHSRRSSSGNARRASCLSTMFAVARHDQEAG